jgi:hypothetical protein
MAFILGFLIGLLAAVGLAGLLLRWLVTRQ